MSTAKVNPYLAEFCGTTLLVLFGLGASANNNLSYTWGHKMGYVGVCVSWGLGLTVAAFLFFSDSGSCFNPAVAVGLAIADLGQSSIDVVRLFGFIGAQLAGSLFGAFLVWAVYKTQLDATEDQDVIGGCFFTSPAVWKPFFNFLGEAIATFILVFSFIGIGQTVGKELAFAPVQVLLVGVAITVVSLALGGTTGYCLNPWRDFGPRLVHWALPIEGKGISHWNYAWIPIVGPFFGAAVAGGVGGYVFRKF